MNTARLLCVCSALLLVGAGCVETTTVEDVDHVTSSTMRDVRLGSQPPPVAAVDPVLPPTGEPSRSSTAPSRRFHFPVDPAVSASYAHDHHSYPATDIFAPCGHDVVAPADGVVRHIERTDRWTPTENHGATRGGLSISIVDADGVRYYMSHLRSVEEALQPGSAVLAGERLGTVGDTGNAAGTGCHVHFGLSRDCPGTGLPDWQSRRGQIWPGPYLDAWRDGGPVDSPSSELLPCGH